MNELLAEDTIEGDGEEVAELTVKREKEKEVKTKTEAQLTVDVLQTEDEVIVQSTIAGVNREDIDISVTNDMVTIKGKRMPEFDVKPSSYDWQELYWGPFSRAIILPVDVDGDKAKALIKNGLLTIRLPKLEKSRTRKIKISD